MYEVACKLTKLGKDIMIHGGSCSFDLSDREGNRYEVKTAKARAFKKDKEHASFRGWAFSSGNNNKNISKFEFTVYVLLNEFEEIEKTLLIPKDQDKFRNGRSATMKDTNYQIVNSPRKSFVKNKWYESYCI